MAVNIPTLNELRTDILADLEAGLGVTIPIFGKNFLRVLALVQAAKLKLYYLAIANIQKNIFVDTAEPEAIGGTLERFGRIKLGRSPFTAKPGSYEVSVTGDIGAQIDVNSTFKSNDDSLNPGKLFVLDANYILVAGPNTITLRALEGGLDSKMNVSDELTATAPIANVDELVIVTAETIEPFAAETTEDYREKSIEAYQLEPQGGAGSDYRIWSADAQGVQKVYPFIKQGFANEIEIFVEATLVDSIDGKGTPSQALLDSVEEVVERDPDTTKPLNERGRRPLGIFNIDFNTISVKEIDIEVVGFNGLTPTIQTDILNALTSAIREIRPFVSSADILADRNDILDVNKITFIILDAAPGAIFDSVSFKIDGVPTITNQFLNGDIPNLNIVSYV